MQRFINWFQVFYIIVLLFAILLICQQGLDPDFGWHLRMGQLILHNGIPKTDPFSYTMPSYPFVDHEWGTNVVIAMLYPILGISGLSILFTLLAFLALFLQCSMFFKKWVILPFILCLTTLVASIGIRPQILSWVFFSFSLRVLLDEKLWRKLRFSLPLVFFLWVNLHGGFAVGIIVFAIFLFIKVWKERKVYVSDWFIFILCLIATLCNPYTYRIWWEVWVSLADGSLRWSIQEWLPAFFVANYDLFLLIPFSLIFIVSTRKNFSLFSLVLYGMLLVSGFASARQIPFWLIVAFPMTAQGLVYFLQDIKHIPEADINFAKVYSICCIIIFSFVTWQVLTDLRVINFDWEAGYPKNAVAYLQEHPSSGQVFSEYGWGGYLIWKLPEKKVFVDGRMPSWQSSNISSSESGDAFREYQNVLAEKIPFSQEMQKYHIDTVLVTSDRLKKIQDASAEDFFDTLSHQPLVSKLNFSKYMQKAGMKLGYKDANAAIYIKQ